MERRKVMTIAAVLISVMVAAGACGKMMGDAPAPAEKAGVSSGDRKAPADSTEKAEAGTADTEKNEKQPQWSSLFCVPLIFSVLYWGEFRCLNYNMGQGKRIGPVERYQSVQTGTEEKPL